MAYAIIERSASFGTSIRGIFPTLDEATKICEQLSKDDNYQSHFDVVSADDDFVISFLWRVGRIVRDFYFGKFGVVTKCEGQEKYNTDFFSDNDIVKEVILEVHLENNKIVNYADTPLYRSLKHLTTYDGRLSRNEYREFYNLETDEERRDFLASKQSV